MTHIAEAQVLRAGHDIVARAYAGAELVYPPTLRHDVFAREAIPNAWGTSGTGDTWARLSGGATLSVGGDGTAMVHHPSSSNVDVALGDDSLADVDIYCRFKFTDLPEVNAYLFNIFAREIDAVNCYRLRIRGLGDGSLFARIERGATPVTDEVLITDSLAADTFYQARFKVQGDIMTGKVWKDGDPEPVRWDVMGTDDTLTQGYVGIRSQRLGSTPNPVGAVLSEFLVFPVTAAQDQVVFAGQVWDIKTGEGRGPGPNNWSAECVEVDGDGKLRLKILSDGNGGWVCGEVQCTDYMGGYGTYEWKVEGDFTSWGEVPVLGLFTYAQSDLNEIDIEVAYWEDQANRELLLFTSYYEAGITRPHSNLPGSVWDGTGGTEGPLTFKFVWSREALYWEARKSDGSLIDWYLIEDPARIPKPDGTEQVMMDLWLRRGNASDVGEVEAVISDFIYSPSIDFEVPEYTGGGLNEFVEPFATDTDTVSGENPDLESKWDLYPPEGSGIPVVLDGMLELRADSYTPMTHAIVSKESFDFSGGRFIIELGPLPIIASEATLDLKLVNSPDGTGDWCGLSLYEYAAGGEPPTITGRSIVDGVDDRNFVIYDEDIRYVAMSIVGNQVHFEYSHDKQNWHIIHHVGISSTIDLSNVYVCFDSTGFTAQGTRFRVRSIG